MDTRAFLYQVLPSSGLLIAAHPKKIDTEYVWINDVCNDIDGVLGRCAEYVRKRQDAYFALASYTHAKVWNPTAKNHRGGLGKFETRTQSNAKSMRSLFLDIDVKQEGKFYRSQQDATRGLMAFGKALQLPLPMVVDSGYGLHAYWTFLQEISTAAWKPIAEQLKAAVVHFNLLTDRPLIADEARVLRVPETFNYKFGQVRPVQLVQEAPGYDPQMLGVLISTYLSDQGVTPQSVLSGPKRSIAVLSGPAAASPLGDNLGATNDPLNPAIMEFECGFFGEQVATRGARASEPEWRAALGLAKYTTDPDTTMRAVSDRHPGFSEAAMQAKVANWTLGPTKCTSIHPINDHTRAVCEACPHWGQIKSPAVVGRVLPHAPPPVVVQVTAQGPVITTIPKPPWPYKRTGKEGKAIVLESEDANGQPQQVTVAPYDLYPIRILRQTEDNPIEESSVWRMHLPRLGPVDVDLTQALITDQRKLYATLVSNGYYILPDQAKSVQQYMSAYLQHLAANADRDKVYDRLGWHDKYTTYVMPNEAYHRDGSVTLHTPGVRINRVTKRAIRRAGTFEQWKKALDFYKGPRNTHFRMFIYAAFASPLFHMTGFKGALIAASGDTGRGKTTVLEACASIFGEPEPLKISGGKDGTTINALYNIVGTLHSIPMLWDETTEREPDEMRKFLLNLPQGKGKERLLEHQRDVTWEGLVLSTANTDDISRLIASGKDSNPHLMRMISVDFETPNMSTSAKIAADAFRRQIATNFGHAGPVFLQEIAKNYEAIKALVERTMTEIDILVQAQSPERYWTAAVAVMYVAAQIAHMLGLHDFDYKADLQWMLAHLHRMRDTIVQAQTTSENLLAEFLDKHFNNILVLSSKATGNVDNIARTPNGPLYIRHEVDTGKLYVVKGVVMAYCTEVKASFKRMEGDLFRAGIIMDRSASKVLGADTPYSRGQVRCWKLDLMQMGGAQHPLQVHAQQLLQAQGAKVVNIQKGVKK